MRDLAAMLAQLVIVAVVGVVVERRWPRDYSRYIVAVGITGTLAAFAIGTLVPAARLHLLGLVAASIAAVASARLALTLRPHDEARRRGLVVAVPIAAILGLRALTG